MLNHLAEFREDVEGIIAAHAAAKHTSQDIQTLKHLLAEAHGCVKNGSSRRDAFFDIDKQIHMTIAETTGQTIIRKQL